MCVFSSIKENILLANADLWRVMYVRNVWCRIKAFFEIFRHKVSLSLKAAICERKMRIWLQQKTSEKKKNLIEHKKQKLIDCYARANW